VVGAVADLTPPELEHVAILRGPAVRVSNSYTFEERSVSAVQHLGDDMPGERDQRKPRTQHDLVKHRS